MPSVAGRRSGVAMSCAASSSFSSPCSICAETPSPDVETFAALSLPDRLVSASPSRAPTQPSALQRREAAACHPRTWLHLWAWLSAEFSAMVISALPVCGVLHHCKQARKQRQGFRIGTEVQSRCLAFSERGSASPQRFHSVHQHAPFTGSDRSNLCAKEQVPAETLQKGCQNHPLCRDQSRRRGGIEASNRASRSIWRARSSASPRSTAREC